MGDKLKNLHLACDNLKKFCQIIKISNCYETYSWPNEEFPKYLNIVIKCYTKLNIYTLFRKIKLIEKKLGRKENMKNFPRTCDIDIIDFRGLKINITIDGHPLICPHPRLSRRNFVLFPLYELNKNWKHPKNKVNIMSLLQNLDEKSLRSIKIF